MVKSLVLLILLFLTALSCNIQKQVNPNEHLVMATLYQQTADEYRALCYQAYNVGRWRLQAMLDTLSTNKRPAVVVDIDETVLDNSPYEGYLIKSGRSFPDGWKSWVNAAGAKAVPGALDFLKFATQNGVDVFYISNRKEAIKAATMHNLKQLGFPQVRADHIFLRTTTSSKESRRQSVLKTHTILLFFGDNLNDFAAVFEHKSIAERFKQTDAFKEKFGKRFIVLPNAMYGEWEGAIYNYQRRAAAAQKRKMRLEHIKAFK